MMILIFIQKKKVLKKSKLEIKESISNSRVSNSLNNKGEEGTKVKIKSNKTNSKDNSKILNQNKIYRIRTNRELLNLQLLVLLIKIHRKKLLANLIHLPQYSLLLLDT